MAKNLVIVESPAKARTIKGFLGKNFVIEASYGHVRDLPKSKLGVDVERDFAPDYVIPTDKKTILKEIRKKIKPDVVVWLATDEDREGEAIGWHLLKALKIKEGQMVKRVAFHEITKDAVLYAIEHPRDINQDLVDAQQARRVLDRLVGYKLSPLLWKKIRAGLSAGRVQSVAMRFISERESEIKAFKVEEYWQMHAELSGKSHSAFLAELIKSAGKAVKISNEKEAKEWEKKLNGEQFQVASIAKKKVEKSPPPPFITSTLQQEAYRKLGFGVKRTMTIAQQLYEGVKLGSHGHVGLITYMRTDSTRMADAALVSAKQIIEQEYGFEYALAKPRFYKGKAKGAQEAHEAIRPTNFAILPEEAKQYLDRDQARLYRLVWRRALASQMQSARLERQTMEISAGDALFQARGQKTEFPGYLRTYIESKEENSNGTGHNRAGEAGAYESGNNGNLDGNNGDSNNVYFGDQELPIIEEGEILELKKLAPSQHFTQPPARYSEASLVKKLESEGIGRPSTYAPIINTIIVRGYVERKEKRLYPTEVGLIVNDFLVEHFPKIVDIAFTAKLEAELDDIAEGKEKWVGVISAFYRPFAEHLEQKSNEIKREDVIKEKTGETCPDCGAELIFRIGRRGKFVACSNYPKCKFSKPTKEEEERQAAILAEIGNVVCDKCGAKMVLKNGRFGEFLGCSAYPECKSIKPIKKDTKVVCAGCGKGTLIEKRTKKGRVFFGCSRYPECDYATWKLGIPGKGGEVGKSGSNDVSKGYKKLKKSSKRLKNCGETPKPPN